MKTKMSKEKAEAIDTIMKLYKHENDDYFKSTIDYYNSLSLEQLKEIAGKCSNVDLDETQN
jgi:NAD(P)H-nitrite reductase large subunit